jgi:hypothetical protein
LLYHGYNPLLYWSSAFNIRQSRANSEDGGLGISGSNRHVSDGILHHDDLLDRVHGNGSGGGGGIFLNNTQYLHGNPIMCFENRIGLNVPEYQTRASNEWMEKTQFITLKVEDRTNVDDQNNCITDLNIKGKIVPMKVKKGISLEEFFKQFRQYANISDQLDIRAWQTRNNTMYFIAFPHAFQFSNEIMVDIGKYPLSTDFHFYIYLTVLFLFVQMIYLFFFLHFFPLLTVLFLFVQIIYFFFLHFFP